MILDDLDAAMKLAKLGEALSVPYEIYAELFPPGEPDETARERAGSFANECGFVIENRIAEKRVRFKKA